MCIGQGTEQQCHIVDNRGHERSVYRTDGPHQAGAGKQQDQIHRPECLPWPRPGQRAQLTEQRHHLHTEERSRVHEQTHTAVRFRFISIFNFEIAAYNSQ